MGVGIVLAGSVMAVARTGSCGASPSSHAS
jgi:hypothetical protein